MKQGPNRPARNSSFGCSCPAPGYDDTLMYQQHCGRDMYQSKADVEVLTLNIEGRVTAEVSPFTLFLESIVTGTALGILPLATAAQSQTGSVPGRGGGNWRAWCSVRA